MASPPSEGAPPPPPVSGIDASTDPAPPLEVVVVEVVPLVPPVAALVDVDVLDELEPPEPAVVDALDVGVPVLGAFDDSDEQATRSAKANNGDRFMTCLSQAG